jgi:hypothetical protein
VRERKDLAADVILGKVEVYGGNLIVEQDGMWVRIKRYEGDNVTVSDKIVLYEKDFETAMPELYGKCVEWVVSCPAPNALSTLLTAIVYLGQLYGPAFVSRKENNQARKYFYQKVAAVARFTERVELDDAMTTAIRSVWPAPSEYTYMGFKEE